MAKAARLVVTFLFRRTMIARITIYKSYINTVSGLTIIDMSAEEARGFHGPFDDGIVRTPHWSLRTRWWRGGACVRRIAGHKSGNVSRPSMPSPPASARRNKHPVAATDERKHVRVERQP